MIFAHLQQGTSNAKRDCLSLTRQATALSFDKNIIITFISQSYQGDLNVLKPQWISLKIFLSVAVIDYEFAGSFLKNDASDGALTATGAYDSLRGESTWEPRLDVVLEVFGFRFRECGGGNDEGGGGFGEARDGDGEGFGSGEGESVWSLGNVGREGKRREGGCERR